MKDFDPTRVEIVDIDKVRPNGWNPKLKDTAEYHKVVESIQVNGFKLPIMVREVEDGYEICDGEQRWTAAKELGFEKVYIYNLGNIPEEEAQGITIWMEENVPMSDLLLAPLVVELNDLGMQMPYDEGEVDNYKSMLNFEFVEDDRPTLTVKCTPEQYENITGKIKERMNENSMTEEQALVDLVKKGIVRYE